MFLECPNFLFMQLDLLEVVELAKGPSGSGSLGIGTRVQRSTVQAEK